MSLTDLASLPNSRIKNRTATRESFTFKVFAPSNADASGTIMPQIGDGPDDLEVTPNGNVKVLDADGNRTYGFLRNMSETEKLYFAYEDVVDIEENGNFILPNSGAGEGFDTFAVAQGLYLKGGASRVMTQIEYGEG